MGVNEKDIVCIYEYDYINESSLKKVPSLSFETQLNFSHLKPKGAVRVPSSVGSEE